MRVTVRPNEEGVLDVLGDAAVVFVRQPGDGAWVNYTGIPDNTPSAIGSILEWMLTGPGLGIGLIAATAKPHGGQRIVEDIGRSLDILATCHEKDRAHTERYIRTLERMGVSGRAFRRRFLDRE